MTPTPASPVPPDELDRRFAEYFRHQLPEPFPNCRALDATEPSSLVHARRPTAAIRSRLTLAASVAALLGLGVTLSSPGERSRQTVKAPSAPGTDLLRTSTANGKHLLEQAGK